MRRSLSKEANPTTGESSSFLVGRRIGLWLCWCDEAGEAGEAEEDSESEEDESSYSVGTTNPACCRSLESQSSNSEVAISGVGPNVASTLLLLLLLLLVLMLLPKSSKLCRERRPALFLSI